MVINESDDADLKSQLMKHRSKIYEYLAGCSNRKRLEIVSQIYNFLPPKRRTKYDFAARVQANVDLDPDAVEDVFKEALSHISHKGILDILSSTFKHVYRKAETSARDLIQDRPHFCFSLYQSVLLKQHGTLTFLDRDAHKTERLLLHFLMKKSTQLTTLLRRFMIEKPAFFQMLATTCLDIQYFTYNHASVVDIWRVKEDMHLGTSFDLFRAMSSLLHLKDYETGLRLYERNPALHADWLFDILLKTYAFRKDWRGMQTIFEGLFGRGDLPNIKHYSIVMDAISKIAGVNIVDTMYENIKVRKMEPTVGIHNSLMYARYALGDVQGVQDAMDRMKDDNVKPNVRSYMILLLTYRDSHDLNASMKVLERMHANGMNLSRQILTTIVSLCAERKDPVNAEKVMGWIKKLGHSPDIVLYNTLLECYMESNYFAKADRLFEKMQTEGMPLRIDTITIMFQHYVRQRRTEDIAKLYKEMNRNNIKADNKFYSVMLEYLMKLQKFEEAEQVLHELEAAGGEPNIYHYTIVMHGYLKEKRYKDVIAVYERLESKNLVPTYETISIVAECLQQDDVDFGISGAGEALWNEYISGQKRVDLTSKYLPRDVLPPQLHKTVLYGHAARADPSKLPEIFRKIEENSGDKRMLENPVILRKVAELYGRSNRWNEFDRYLDLLLEKLAKQYVPTKLANKKIVQAIPKSERFSNDVVFRLKFKEMAQFGEVNKILPWFLHLTRDGFDFSNRTQNEVVRLLIDDDSTLADAFKFAEKRLLHGNFESYIATGLYKQGLITRKDQKARVGYFKMAHSTITLLKNNYGRLLGLIAKEHGCRSEAEALQIYTKNHRRMAKFMRQQKKRSRWQTARESEYLPPGLFAHYANPY